MSGGTEPTYTVEKYGRAFSIKMRPCLPRWMMFLRPFKWRRFYRELDEQEARQYAQYESLMGEFFFAVTTDPEKWARERERELRIRAYRKACAEGRA